VIHEKARAKVNLSLEMKGRRCGGPHDGYHALESLIVFPEIADHVTVEIAKDLHLEVTGPRADELKGLPQEENLAYRAVSALRIKSGVHQGAKILLEKHLPSASGIGGGSADAAAVLRAVSKLWGLAQSRDDFCALCLSLGADVPAAFKSEAALMSGVGETVEPLSTLPQFWMVLANCGVPVQTSNVFKALNISNLASDAAPLVPSLPSMEALLSYLDVHSNHMQAVALVLEPKIGETLVALEKCANIALARMSGSGATCFGLFATRQDAEAATQKLQQAYPTWWVASGEVGPVSKIG
jgi:4-diphosphocytidyl-2-C-methyl-D-erythritol kinase